MNNIIDVSLIIPEFNDSDGIKRLLNSIDNINQLREIIIVDDNSTSSEFEKVLELTKHIKNVKVVLNNSNGNGAGAARNVGLSKASGKWILFADSDDHFLNNFTKSINKYSDVKADIIYFPPLSLDEYGELGTRHKVYESYFDEYYETKDETALRYMLPVVWSTLFNNEFIKTNNICFEEIMVANDKMFSILTGHKARNIIVADEKIYSWDFKRNSLTTSVSEEKYDVIIDGLIRQANFFKENVSVEIFNRVTDSIVKVLATCLFRNKFGILYSAKVFLKLKRNNIPLTKISDLSRIKNFFINNRYYKKTNI